MREMLFYTPPPQGGLASGSGRGGDDLAFTEADSGAIWGAKSVTVDWQKRESVRAKMRNMIRIILRRYKYPPDKQKAAIEMVMCQAEVLSDEWSAEAPEKSDYTMRMAMPAQKRDEELPLAAEPDQGIVGEENVKETRD